MKKHLLKTPWNLIFFVGMILTFAVFGPSLAAEYPTKPIELICPFGAGGPVSLADRILADKLTEILKQPVVTVHKPGASGAIAAAYVAKARPDGYTLFDFTSASNGTVLALRSDVSYTNADFETLGQYGTHFLAMVVKAEAPWKNVKDVVEYAKKNPGVLKFGSSGVGTTLQFGMELFKIAAGGLKIDHIPFKSAPEINAALLGGHIQLGTFTWGTSKALYDAKKVRVLAVTIPAEELPGIPTFAQEGYPEINLTAFYGLAAPKGLPKEISKKLQEACAIVFQDPKTKDMLRNIGLTPDYKNAKDFALFAEDRLQLFKRIAKEANIKLD
jgi:tripartite-type tricarboxylate transporter receptor subunit TctC